MMLRRFSRSVAVAQQGETTPALVYPMTNFASLRGGDRPLRIVHGKGARVTDAEGREYIEAMAGLWCTGLGWGNEELVDAAAKQMRELSYYHGFGGRQVPVSEELAVKLIDLAPKRLRGGRVFFGLSGSDANDSQIKMLWHYNHVLGRPHKRKLISRLKGYHGVSVASGSLTGLPHIHADMGLPLEFVPRHVSCPSYYRGAAPGEREEEFVARLAAELDAAITQEDPETVAAFIAEPLQGAGGVYLPPAGYFDAIRKVLDCHGIPMVGDEVITGFGRTGHFWGCEAFGQEPDYISCSKQLTSGYLPLSAAMIPGPVYDTLEDAARRNPGVFGHGYTYSGHPVACAVALKVLEIIERDRVVQTVHERLGPLFQRRLRALADHPLVGEARGIGLVGAIELVADKASKASYPPSRGVSARLARFGIEHGLIVRALPGDIVALCPPLVVTESDIDEIFDRLSRALASTLDSLASGPK